MPKKKKEATESVQLCSNCSHAASNTSGEWCTEFKEPILNDRVAMECPAFDGEWEEIPLPPNVRPIRDTPEHVEKEATISLLVELDYFGNPDIEDSIISRFRREVALKHANAKVKRA